MRTLIGLVFFVLAACGGSKATTTTTTTGNTGAGKGPQGSAAEAQGAAVTVGVSLQIAQPDAIVLIDDQNVGKAGELAPAIALEPGLHTLEVSQEGFKTYRAEFAVTDKVEAFTVNLEPQK